MFIKYEIASIYFSFQNAHEIVNQSQQQVYPRSENICFLLIFMYLIFKNFFVFFVIFLGWEHILYNNTMYTKCEGKSKMAETHFKEEL